MKVLLLNPPWYSESGFGVRSNSRWPHTRKDKALPFPIYQAYTAAVLEQNDIYVEFMDAVAEEKEISHVIAKVKEGNFDLVVIESSTPSIEFDLNTAKMIKSQSLALSGDKEPRLVLGLTYRSGGEIVSNAARPLIQDLDSMPFPAWHLFNMEYYDQHLYNSPSVLMISSRGCPYHCTYCLWPQIMYGHKFRTRSAENVVDEIELLIKNHDVKEIEFDDDTFTIGKKRVLSICNEIKKRGIEISWSCFGRPDVVDKEMLTAMKEAGCEFIKYGVESGSQELLDMCKRGMTLDQVREAFRITKEVGIKDYGTFLFGIPGETWDTVKETIEFAKELDPYAVQFSVVTPYPGTELYDNVKSEGHLLANDWSEFDGAAKAVIETEELTRDDLEKAFALAWKEFYLRPAFFMKSLKCAFSSKQGFIRVVKGARSFFVRYRYYRRFL
jgi:radical SAM superfamily enzyme YgiQ (UPF0313 family)